MKIITLNIEGSKHVQRVLTFLERENADIICLQEAQLDLQDYFTESGYTFATLPMTLRTDDTHHKHQEGLLIASKHSATFDSFYYHQPAAHLQAFKKGSWYDTCAYGVLFADVTIEGTCYRIGTTHATWTPDGKPNNEQDADLDAFLSQMEKYGSHVMCGDFNIPRLHNRNYERLASVYTDTVPLVYKSSLDRQLHRCGTDPARSIMFDEYMVDYIFTQPPYRAANVRLEFGVSDHAAVIADIFLE